jgi:predicted permease
MLLLLQAAVSVMLLVGTGLFLRSLRNVANVHLGLDVDRLVNGMIDLRSVGIDSTAADNYFEQAREAAATLPGVEAVTLADAAPFGGWSVGTDISTPDRDSLPTKAAPYQSFVASNYFSTVGTRITQGRGFTDADAATAAAPVVIISESIASWIWPGQSPIGRCIYVGDRKKNPCSEVIGVAQTAHRNHIAETQTPMQVYLPLAPGKSDARTRVLIVRPSTADPTLLIEPVRRVMQSVVPGVPFANVSPMRNVLDDEMRPWQLGATMFAAFGLIALILSSLGLYSVVAYTVAQRMHEMGVRVALGAQVNDIRRLVLSQGLRHATVGVALGTIGALVGGRFIAPMLFETSPRDPTVFMLVITLLLGVATLASLVPARRATQADPLVALRSD